MYFNNFELSEELKSISKELDMVFEYFRTHDMRGLPAESFIPLEEDNVFIMTQEYWTCPVEERDFESHNNFWDVMYIAEGCEIMGRANEKSCPIKVPYDAEHDLTWLGEPEEEPTWISLYPGDFIIISPNEAHKSRVMIGEPTFIRKHGAKIRKKG